MAYISKINTYHNEKGIEIQEEELISGEFPELKGEAFESVYRYYTAIVNIQINTPEGAFSQPISAKFIAENIEKAFVEAEPLLKKEIDNYKKQTEEAIKKAKDDEPRIIY